MVLAQHLCHRESAAFLARLSRSLSALWRGALVLWQQCRLLLLGAFMKLHTGQREPATSSDLLLPSLLHLKLTENTPSNNGQVVAAKKEGKNLLNWYCSTIDAGNLQYGSIPPVRGIKSQLTLNEYSLNGHKRSSMTPFILENIALPSTKNDCRQYYLNDKFNQDLWMTDGNYMDDRHIFNQYTITKKAMREWNIIVADQEECSFTDNEEWGDSEEESDTQCNSDESLSDEDQNGIIWKSFFTSDIYHPLNFTAHFTSSSSKIVGEELKEQCLEENEKNHSLTKVTLSTAQNPILSQRDLQYFCTLSMRENVKLCVWKKSSKCSKSEESSKAVHKPASKKLRFSPIVKVHTMVAWSFALREARKGHWMQMAHDRVRFMHRIQNTEMAIAYCLQKDHRMKIWEKIQSRIM
ncbi:protein phosphatase 1 regulatory subunit 15B [Narcine bancroftii]|uniref:protein phosphatase 1 regulatory subunit 15B n=1 Tax=Narcine bancroftii TaxID=1343680 RepID=UPI0038311386